MPKVSVIIPTYNRAWCLRNAIESVLEQTFRDLELLVIDDGSTDSTHELVASCSTPIRYFFQENRGFCAAWNAGVEKANGEYISFLNSDDILLKDAISLGVEVMDKHPEVGLVYGQGYHVDLAGRYLFVKKSVSFDNSCVVDGKELIREMLSTFRIETNGMIVRRDCFDRVGKFPEDFGFAGEIPWLVRVAKHYPLGYLAVPLSTVTHHPGQLLWTCDPMDAERGYLATMAEIFEDPVLEAHFRSIRGKAYSTYYQRIAGHAYGKDMKMTRRYIRKALMVHPQSMIGRKGFSSFYVYLKSFVPHGEREAIRGLKRQLFGSRAAQV